MAIFVDFNHFVEASAIAKICCIINVLFIAILVICVIWLSPLPSCDSMMIQSCKWATFAVPCDYLPFRGR